MSTGCETSVDECARLPFIRVRPASRLISVKKSLYAGSQRESIPARASGSTGLRM